MPLGAQATGPGFLCLALFLLVTTWGTALSLSFLIWKRRGTVLASTSPDSQMW